MLNQIEGWRAYARLHRKQTDPRRRAIAANMMDHYKWEVLGEPDKILAGVHPDAVYRFYGLGGDTLIMSGHSEIRVFYQQMVETGGNVLQQDIDNLLVDDEVVAGQGVWHHVMPGKELTGEGLSAPHPAVDETDAQYLVSQRYAWFMPYSSDEIPLLLGEIVYFHPPLLSVRKLEQGEAIFGKVTEDMFAL